MTQPQEHKPLPVEPPHVMTPAQFKRFVAAHYQLQAVLAKQESKRQ